MKYRDLINFEPITNVIQLRDADSPLFAEELVRSFVASKSMEECFTKLVFPHLQFDHFNDNKALMIVGNYGTGKSHMMSVISAIAQDANNVMCLSNQAIKDASKDIAGKFKVVRIEAGAAQNSLENIILKLEVQKHLDEWKVQYKFPDFSTISNYKDCINDMMSAFSSKYPNQGILIVIDELLEYLRSKNEQALFSDLAFFRQLAESCKDTKLRVVVGMQESVFDSPYFKFAGDVLNKIKDRTQLVTIKKDDIKYVVAERLLKKTASQKAQIRDYLEKFKPYYGNLNSNFEDFVSLFPIHPAYIDAFSRMVRVEKREVLKSVSNELSTVIDNDIPEDSLELITIDRYWSTVANDAALDAYEGIKEVKDCNVQLQNKVKQIKPQSYVPMAKRIIDALSVQRLESTDVSTPVGLTARELKDNLCLYNQMVKNLGDSEDDLLTVIESTLTAIMKAVNGQFIEKTLEGQYYINIRKTYDYDQVISAKIEQLTTDDLNNSYYSILKLVLDIPEQSAFMNNKIWDHELQFLGHKMYRKGWLFFGIPDERPTAVPEKDFYLFFIPPFNSPRYKDTGKSDELIFKLKNMDQEFDSTLRCFAATTNLAQISSQMYKATFQNKADEYGRQLSNWLNNHFFDDFTISYEEKTKRIKDWTVNTSLRGITGIGNNDILNFRERFDAVSSCLLSSNFSDIAPDYPKFSIKLTESNLKTSLADAIRYIATGTSLTNTAFAVLSGLGLMENGQLRPIASPYANWIVCQLNSKPEGVVLRHDEIIESPHPYFDCMKKYRLEKPFVSVLLMALVYSGDIILTLKGDKYDASNLKNLLVEGVDGITEFSSISKPVDWNPAVIKSLLILFNQPEGLFNQIKAGDDSVVQSIQTENVKIIDELARDSYNMRSGIILFGSEIKPDAIGESDLKGFIENLKNRFEELKAFNNCGKLKNLKKTQFEISSMKENLAKERRMMDFAKKVSELNDSSGWFDNARTILPAGNAWIMKYNGLKNEAIQTAQKWDATLMDHIQSKFEILKSDYIKIYSGMHAKARLSGSDAQKYSTLLHSNLVEKLTKLSRVSILPKTQFESIHNQLLTDIKECNSLKEADLRQTPICPHCSYNPAMQGEEDACYKLNQIEEKLENILDEWTKTIVEDLQDPCNVDTIQLMTESQQAQIKELVSTETLPENISDDYVKMLDEALKGLVKKPIKKESFCKKLVGDGKPITVKELRLNFDKFLMEISQNEDEESIRIVLE